MINLMLKSSKSKKKFTKLSNQILSKINNKFNKMDFTIIYKMWDEI